MEELTTQGRAVREASKALAQASDEERRGVLERVADLLEELQDELLAVNAAEVAAYDESGPGRDRLTLPKGRIEAMASALRGLRRTDSSNSARALRARLKAVRKLAWPAFWPAARASQR